MFFNKELKLYIESKNIFNYNNYVDKGNPYNITSYTDYNKKFEEFFHFFYFLNNYNKLHIQKFGCLQILNLFC